MLDAIIWPTIPAPPVETKSISRYRGSVGPEDHNGIMSWEKVILDD